MGNKLNNDLQLLSCLVNKISSFLVYPTCSLYSFCCIISISLCLIEDTYRQFAADDIRLLHVNFLNYQNSLEMGTSQSQPSLFFKNRDAITAVGLKASSSSLLQQYSSMRSGPSDRNLPPDCYRSGAPVYLPQGEEYKRVRLLVLVVVVVSTSLASAADLLLLLLLLRCLWRIVELSRRRGQPYRQLTHLWIGNRFSDAADPLRIQHVYVSVCAF